MESSILPFLPRMYKTDSGSLQWPTELGLAFKSLIAGPLTSRVHGSETLCDFINDVREQSHLPTLSSTVLDGISQYFDKSIERATAQNFFESLLPFIGSLAFRLPALLNDHFSQSMFSTPPIKLVSLRVLEPQQDGFVYMSQEEIRFVINPELLAGMLFMPAMQPNEAIEISGAERFSCYTGYSSSFCFAGNYIDNKPRDLQGRRKTCVVAIDALVHPGRRQYEEALMLREANKAFCGFLDHLDVHFTELITRPSNMEPQNTELCAVHDAVNTANRTCTTGIATGNWGCGAFGGDVELKSLLQWIAASQAGRPFLHYYTFGGSHGRKLQQVADWIINEKWVIGELWGLLVEYGEKRLQGVHKRGLFEWLLPHLSKGEDGARVLITGMH